MKKLSIYISVLFLLAGCAPRDEEDITLDLKKYPGSAVVGNGEICVVYSDDQRVFDSAAPVPGGIRRYYHGDFDRNYIHGSMIEFLTDTGAVTMVQDTFGLAPFFSPYRTGHSEFFDMESRIFMTEEGITVQRIEIKPRRDLDTFIRWTLNVPAEVGLEGETMVRGYDVLDDGLYIRYGNGLILSIGTYGERNQFLYDRDNGIASATAPLRLTAERDTTITFFVTSGYSDTEVITRLFAVDDGDLFETASGQWMAWLDRDSRPAFPDDHYRDAYDRNRYALFASIRGSDLAGGEDAGTIGTSIGEEAADSAYIELYGDIDTADEILRRMIENTNSYGLITGRSFSDADETVPVFPDFRNAAKFIRVFHYLYSGTPNNP
jgi:hypothetical protein